MTSRNDRLAAAALAALLLAGCGASPAGSRGQPLSTSSDVGPGAQCPSGGQMILSGIDLNGDGILEASEVAQVAYVCNGAPTARCTTLEGGVTIHNSLEWADLVAAGCTRITGTLEIATAGATTFGAASPLTQVGALSVQGNDVLAALAFPSLVTVDGDVTVADSPALAHLDLHALASVGGSLQVSGTLLQVLHLPVLGAVGGDLRVSAAPELLSVDLGALTGVGGTLELWGSDRLGSVALGRLGAAGGVLLSSLPSLGALDLTALASTDYLGVYINDALARLALPALVRLGGMTVADNPSLHELAFPVLTVVDGPWFDVPVTAGGPGMLSLSFPVLPRATQLSIGGPDVQRIDLPVLATVDAVLGLSAGPGTVVELPALRSVGSFQVMGEGPGQVAAPLLELVDGDVLVITAALATLELPSLTTVNGSLSVWRSNAPPPMEGPAPAGMPPSTLRTVSLPALTLVSRELVVGNQPALEIFSAPNLATSGGISFTGLPSLPALSLPVLARIEAIPLTLGVGWRAASSNGDLVVADAAALQSIDLPLLGGLTRDLRVAAAPALVSLGLPTLGQVGRAFRIGDNAALDQCQVDAILARLLTPPGGAVDVSGNGGTGTCP